MLPASANLRLRILHDYYGLVEKFMCSCRQASSKKPYHSLTLRARASNKLKLCQASQPITWKEVRSYLLEISKSFRLPVVRAASSRGRVVVGEGLQRDCLVNARHPSKVSRRHAPSDTCNINDAPPI